MAKKHTGVIFSLYGSHSGQGFSEFPQSDLQQPLFKSISQKFNKIVVLLEENIDEYD